MRKHFKKAVGFVLCGIVAVFAAVALSGCSVKILSASDFGASLGLSNLADQAEITSSNGKSLPYTDNGYGEISVVFHSEKQINAVVLSEKSSSVDDFEIRAKAGGEWIKLYRQDYIRKLRYCVFAEITATELAIRFKSSHGEFTISDLAVYHVPKTEKDFRVVSYLDVMKIRDLEEFDKTYHIDGFQSVTDVILCGGAEFRSDGTLEISEAYHEAFVNLKEVELRLGKRFNVYCNLRPSSAEFALGNFDSENAQYGHAMKNNRDRFVRELNAFLVESATDGISFDWRYPEKNSDWKTYSDFLTKMKASMETGRKLTVALAGWSCSLNRSAIDALDLVQVMSYDLPDNTGNHSSFERVIYDTEKLMLRGIPAQKLCLGIPFYARETEGSSARWFYYRDEAENLGRAYNVISNALTLENGEIYTGKRYYNGYLMVRDKTAYAYDSGLGGVMFWEHAADANYYLEVDGKPVSLIRAISDATSMRK